MKRRIVMTTAVALATAFLIGRNTATAEPQVGNSSAEFYQNLAEELNIVQVRDASELSIEDIQQRNGNILIEEVIGVVTSAEGDGHALNYDGNYYINYSRVPGAEVGTVVLSYFIYNPDTDYEDDIIARYDYIIDTGYEVE